MFLLRILAGYQNFPRINIEVPIAPLASKHFPQKHGSQWRYMKKSSVSPSPASIPAKWLCQRPSCLPVLLESSRAPPLHPLSPSHEQQYSPGGKWEDLVPSGAKNELKFQEHVGFSFQFRCLIQKLKKEKRLQTFHGPSINSQHSKASLACQVEHFPRMPTKILHTPNLRRLTQELS